MENALSEGTLTLDQNVKSEFPFGLRVDIVIERVQKDKPYTYQYIYSLDSLKFKEWLEENKYLCEGPLAFTAKGIQVVIPAGVNKWDKASFSIDDENGDQMYLNILEEDVVIYVHRDLFAGKEWEIHIEASEEDIPF
jgi:hypothetical protein